VVAVAVVGVPLVEVVDVVAVLDLGVAAGGPVCVVVLGVGTVLGCGAHHDLVLAW
jgi:hypothetical protein